MDNPTISSTGPSETGDTNELYQKALEIAQQYMGPVAQRFMNRQIEQHLHAKPEDIKKEDIPELAKWIKTSAALLTDKKTADDFAEKISTLS